jgi:hypothetical protein
MQDRGALLTQQRTWTRGVPLAGRLAGPPPGLASRVALKYAEPWCPGSCPRESERWEPEALASIRISPAGGR